MAPVDLEFHRLGLPLDNLLNHVTPEMLMKELVRPEVLIDRVFLKLVSVILLLLSISYQL